MKYGICLAIGLLSLFVSPVRAQDNPDLDKLDDKVSRHLTSQMVGWTHKRGEPIQGSKNVVVEFWSLSNRVVKITILPQKSAQAVREKMQSFVRITPEAQELKGFGDEAYSWGYEGSNVVFRRGRVAVFVSTVAEVDADLDIRGLSKLERSERMKSEMRRLSREFAKHVATAIDAP
jgi:hypothetical protein